MADLSPQQLLALIAGDGAQLIDVREPDEYDAGRIAGVELIPLGELTARADSIDRSRPVIFVCRSGARSGMATEAFLGAGYEAHNLTGGMQAWAAAGLPLEPTGGYVA